MMPDTFYEVIVGAVVYGTLGPALIAGVVTLWCWRDVPIGRFLDVAKRERARYRSV